MEIHYRRKALRDCEKMGRISEKSDEDLQKLYLLRVQSSVQSLKRQYVKLSKAWRAREHSMDEATKVKILAYIADVVNAFEVSIKQTEETPDDKFKLVTDADKARVMPKVDSKPIVKPTIQAVKPTVPVTKK